MESHCKLMLALLNDFKLIPLNQLNTEDNKVVAMDVDTSSPVVTTNLSKTDAPKRGRLVICIDFPIMSQSWLLWKGCVRVWNDKSGV
jgi:hypothetical protein